MSLSTEQGSTVDLGGVNVLSFTLTRPYLGIPTLVAELDVGDAPAPTGRQVLTYTTPTGPVTATVTVVESQVAIGRATVFAVGGSGGLRAVLRGLDYAEVRPRLVVEDILAEAGEVGDAVALAALDALPHLRRWCRPAGTGRAALTRLAAELGLVWRMTAAGVVWIGIDAWTPWKDAERNGQPYYIGEPNAHGIATVALDGPTLAPGMTVLPPDDQAATTFGALMVSDVVDQVTEDGAYRTRFRTVSPNGVGQGRGREHWIRAVRGLLPPLDLRVPWAATVVDQDDAGMLGLTMDAGAPLLTLSGVEVWPGLPGYSVWVPRGARCIVDFLGGREDSPVVRSFAPRTAVTLLRFDDGHAAFSRVGDAVRCGTLAGTVAGVPVEFVWTPETGAASTGQAVNVAGVVKAGNVKHQG